VNAAGNTDNDKRYAADEPGRTGKAHMESSSETQDIHKKRFENRSVMARQAEL
jgi:hypothetical protein